jgi:uncharacterized protein
MGEKSVKVAVLADTHMSRLSELPNIVLETLARADVIIHLGDFTSLEMLTDLRKMGNFYGIYGNHDRLPILRKELKKIEVIELNGKRLGIIHGFFCPVSSQRRMKFWFKEHNIDILLYGHTHSVLKKNLNGVLLVNPGSVICKFPATKGSFGLLTLDSSMDFKVISTGDNLPFRKRLLFTVPALIIRNGTRFLESWPYIDTAPLVSLFRKIWGLVRLNYQKLTFRRYDKAIQDANAVNVTGRPGDRT